MGIYFRKSIKFDPVRMNLGKSGIGYSIGVKGARIGISPSGQSYISGGAKGIYFRQNLSKINSNDQTTSELNENSDISDNVEVLIKDSPQEIFLLIIALLTMIILPFLIHGSLFFLGIILLIAKSFWSSGKVEKFKRISEDLEKPLTKDILEKIEKSLINLHQYQENVINFSVASLIKILPSIARDKVFDDYEKELTRILYKTSASKNVDEIIANSLAEIIWNFSLDKKLDNEEKKFIFDILNHFNPDQVTKQNFLHLIDLFEKLDEIRASDALNAIQPSTNVLKNSEIGYFESTIEILNNKSRKIAETGTLLITNERIHILSNGHKSIKLEDIISIKLERPLSDDLEIVIRNRKTPIIVKSTNNIIFFVILEKLLKNLKKIPEQMN
jgi:hypothetical protein